MKKQLNSTSEIQEASEIVLKLQQALPSILHQYLWQHKVPIEEKVTFLKQIASARRALMQTVEAIYPEVKGHDYSIGNIFVEYEAPDESTTPPPPSEDK